MGNKPLRRLVFGHRGEVVKAALAHYSSDVRRMKACLHGASYEASDEDLVAAWLYHSQRSAAIWLPLPVDDQQLLADLLGGKFPPLVSALPPRQFWIASIDEAGDGSGDQILTLPDDLMTITGWMVDDTLEVSRLDGGEVRLRKRSTL